MARIGPRSILLLWLLILTHSTSANYHQKPMIVDWLAEFNAQLETKMHVKALAHWNYLTNLTKHNQKLVEISEISFANWLKPQISTAREYRNTARVTCDNDCRRQLNLISNSADLQDENSLRKLSQVSTRLEKSFAAATVQKGNRKRKYSLEPELLEVMSKSRDPDELLWAWWSWRNATGPHMRRDYNELIDLLNRGAKQNGYSDMGEYWRIENYELREMDDMVDELWAELRPLYLQLHAYVRRRLIERYPQLRLSASEPIPAHLLGNMWAQDWSNILDFVSPSESHSTTRITDEIRRQKYTSSRMFHKAEGFFVSVGLEKMTPQFWTNSIFEKPTDRTIDCHGAAFDFHYRNDFRIKMCTIMNMENLETVHHEMGHIEYFMQYRHLPTVYHQGANSAFHEAVGDTIALSVSTPNHLKEIGLLKSTGSDGINFLLRQALKKIAFLPFGLLMDKWRWDVFRGKINARNYNKEWWAMRLKYQGLKPPIKRSESDFDPGAKYHIAANVPYIRYFLSFISQFQFQDAMCKAMQFKGPLYDCDIYKSKVAGEKLRSMLKLGGSRPWQDAMMQMTGDRKFDTKAILSYFSPLLKWLKEKNVDEIVGW